MWRMPESLGLISLTGHNELWTCPDCGTYYGFDVFSRGWPQGSCQTTLWRLTPAEAMEKYGHRARKGTPQDEELQRYQEGLPKWMRDMQAYLSHADSAVRERAAQAIASHFRVRFDWAAVTRLLGHTDASIRRGTLLAFDSIRFVSLARGPADIVPDLLKSLMDPDASVARQAVVLLNRVDDKNKTKQILDQVNAIPTERRTPAVRMFLLAHSFEALTAGLADPEKEVRQEALSKALERSLSNTPVVERLRTALRAVPEASRTPEVNAYLSHENPEQWDEDD